MSKMLEMPIELNYANVIGGFYFKAKHLEKVANFVIVVAKWSIHKYHVCNLEDTFPSVIVARNELYQRAQAQKIDILLKVM